MEEALGLASQVPIDPILPGTSIGE
jgi:hypothetical protein